MDDIIFDFLAVVTVVLFLVSIVLLFKNPPSSDPSTTGAFANVRFAKRTSCSGTVIKKTHTEASTTLMPMPMGNGIVVPMPMNEPATWSLTVKDGDTTSTVGVTERTYDSVEVGDRYDSGASPS